ncbi:Pycsar system effector family protein [Streptomyces sp. L500]
MTSGSTNHQDDSGLDRALKSATEALGKTDTKAALLFALDAGLAAMIRTALSDGPSIARIISGVASGLVGVSIVFIALAVLPRLHDDGHSSFLRWAKLTPEEIREAVREDARCEEVGVLSRLALIKYRRLQVACLASAGAALLLLAADHLAALH